MTKNLERAELHVVICVGSDCKKRGARDLRRAAKSELRARGWRRRSSILRTRCTGNCKRAPVCGLLPDNTWLARASPEELTDAIRAHIDANEDS